MKCPCVNIADIAVRGIIKLNICFTSSGIITAYNIQVVMRISSGSNDVVSSGKDRGDRSWI